MSDRDAIGKIEPKQVRGIRNPDGSITILDDETEKDENNTTDKSSNTDFSSLKIPK